MAEPQRSLQSYALGIDLGTTYSAAAIVRGPVGNPVVEVCVLGTIAAQIPTVVVHREDSEILTGEAAERRSATEPTRTAREFKRRLGDPVPIIVGGVPYGAEALMAEMLEAIVRQVTEREGQAPATITLTHPANYTEYKRGLLRESARLAGLDLDRLRLITEPEAAAIAYAHQQRVEPGEIVAVYDLGGGTFDAAVVRNTGAGFELAGTPEGMERLGGIDFDQAVLSHVDAVLDGMVSSADNSDPQVLAGQSRLRDECRRAKEALSNDTDATIPVSIPGVQTEVRLTRDELEQMVRPRIAETVKALQRTIASAQVGTDDVSRVLLVGGSSRMPIVAHIIREAIGRPVSADADPKLAIAVGAALSSVLGTPSSHDVTAGPMVHSAAEPVAAPAASRSAVRDRAMPGRRRRLVAVGIAVVVATAVIVTVAVRGGNKSNGASSSSVAVTTLLPSTVNSVGAVGTVGTTGVAGNQKGGLVAVTGPAPVASTTPTETSPIRGPDGAVERFAFDGTVDGSGIPGAALQAGAPGAITGVSAASNGDVYVASAGASVVKVRGGQVEVVAQLTPNGAPSSGIAVGSDGAVFVATAAGIVRLVDGNSELILDGPANGLTPTLGPLSLDGGGNLYIADNGSSRIIRRAPDGTLTLVAGTGRRAASGSEVVDGGAAVTTDLGFVTGLVVDGSGNLLIADTVLNRVRAVAPGGTITTFAGGGTVDSQTVARSGDSAGTSATDLVFGSVDGIAVDQRKRIYVADGASHGIVRIGSDGVAAVFLADTQANALAITPTGALVFSDGVALWSVVGAADSG